ncbi:hypothetical protein CKM354_001009000 [Cercospora kikuchii]|uniref:F-box domain-containing protein n=1 Tax=Cercospora kikuchii TaxID=84275 RepID=A0A9P3CQD5_9PEZI|nr:uncharacterized protein CKM354_001009000 [Cercospora kikuchii]GIZ46988.1 hypothetical protein CKM354_001009000 [Cercospora kikuchii]
MARNKKKQKSQQPTAGPESDAPSSHKASTPAQLLGGLPVELQLRILSHLPAKQILSCRRIDRHFRDMIDLEENHGLLIGPSIAASMERFDTFVKRYCEFPLESKDSGTDFFLDAVTDYIEVCDIWAVNWVEKIDGFMEFLVQRSNDEFPNGGPFAGRQAWQLGFDFNELCDYAVGSFQYRMQNVFDEIYGEKVEIIIDRMRAFLLDHARHPAEYVPKYPVTGPHAPLVPGIPMLARAPQMPHVGRAMGVPVLPRSSPFTYYAASIWAQDKTLDARNDEMVVEGVERAVLLEETFIACI